MHRNDEFSARVLSAMIERARGSSRGAFAEALLWAEITTRPAQTAEAR